MPAMSTARAAVELAATAAEIERRWADPAGWGAFVDGFDHLAEADPAWPAPGARLVWDSHPGGRGRVREQVLSAAPGAELVVAVEDPQLRGTQRLAFKPLAGGRLGVSLELDYVLLRRGPFMLVADPLFVRRALRDSLRRTLTALAAVSAGSAAGRP
jgi:hypothetical protein